MIVEERIGTDLVKHYSDIGKKIRQIGDGNLMDTAVDVYPCPYEYEEFDGEIPDEIDDGEAFDIIFGGAE